MLPEIVGGPEQVTAGGLVLPATAVLPPNIERAPEKENPGQATTRLLSEILTGVQGSEKLLATISATLSAMQSAMVESLELFKNFMAIQDDLRQDKAYQEAKAPAATTGVEPPAAEQETFSEMLQKLVREIGSSLMFFVAFIAATFRNKIVDLMGRVGAMLSPILRMGGALLRGISKFALFLGAFVAILDGIEGFLRGLSEGGNLYTALREGFLNIVQGFLAVPGDLLALVTEMLGFEGAAKTIQAYSDLAVDRIIAASRTLIDGLVNLPFILWEGVKKMAREILDALPTSVKALLPSGTTDFLAASNAHPLSETETGEQKGGRIQTRAEKNKSYVPAPPPASQAAVAPTGQTNITDAVRAKVNAAHNTIAGAANALPASDISAPSSARSAASTIIVAPATNQTVNAPRTTVHSTPSVPLHTRNQEPAITRMSDVTLAFRG